MTYDFEDENKETEIVKKAKNLVEKINNFEEKLDIENTLYVKSDGYSNNPYSILYGERLELIHLHPKTTYEEIIEKVLPYVIEKAYSSGKIEITSGLKKLLNIKDNNCKCNEEY